MCRVLDGVRIICGQSGRLGYGASCCSMSMALAAVWEQLVECMATANFVHSLLMIKQRCKVVVSGVDGRPRICSTDTQGCGLGLLHCQVLCDLELSGGHVWVGCALGGFAARF